ncbi:MAG: nicotinate phosphoribosyltransferase [Lachnospiraceae bacterium]|nr:nicotinate phosphoribosyltransferase [Lachnospiraceae bacterium]
MDRQNLTLLTDFYELTMMQGYFRNENANDTVIFDMFYRTNPQDSGYAIMAGLDQLIQYIKGLSFSNSDILYLRSLKIFDEDFLTYLKTFKFTGSIWAIPEGTVVFPREPLVKVIAPIMQAQLIETAILTIINHQSLIATKASRVCYAARGDGVMEFGLRRAQGPDAGIYGARAAVIGGCIGTSNVLAGQLFDIPVLGTNAHSWVMSFPDELTAFRKYAEIYPDSCLFVVDTYDTLDSGIPHAIQVFDELKEKGIRPAKYGIRIDSGDLAYLSKKARTMLDNAGYTDAIISASNDLDEFLIDSLKVQNAKISSWGVGTNLITSKGWPAFGGVYKLAAIKSQSGDFIPKIKLSENTEKVTNPGNKKIFRIYDEPDHKVKADLICLEDEDYSEDTDIEIFDPNETWKKTLLRKGTFSLREIMIPIFDEGKSVYESPSVMEIRENCVSELSTLWDETRRLVNPHKVYVDLSPKLYDMKISLLNQMK